jgi:hypothetical protein
VIRLRAEGDLPASANAARQAIVRFPLAGWLHYQLGLTLLRLGGREEEADATFRAQRLLNPNAPQIAVDQGALWLPIDPKRTLALWIDAIEARERAGRGEASALTLFADSDWSRRRVSGPPTRSLPRVRKTSRVRSLRIGAPVTVTCRGGIVALSAKSVFIQSLTETERAGSAKRGTLAGTGSSFSDLWKSTGLGDGGLANSAPTLLDAGKFEEAIRAAASTTRSISTCPSRDKRRREFSR